MAFGCVAHVAEAWIMGTLEQIHKHKISSTVEGNIMGTGFSSSSSFSFFIFILEVGEAVGEGFY